MKRIRITGGRVIDPANSLDAIRDLCVAEGRVLAVGVLPEGFEADLVIDARHQVVCPGLVDLRVRLREPGFEHKATIESETRAAAAGGITTLCCPPDTDPVIDTPAVVELIHQRARHAGAARVEVLGALTRGLDGHRLAEMGALGDAGCRGVSNADVAVRDTEVMHRALQYAATFGLTVFLRPEDPCLARDRVVHDGEVSTRLGLAGIPEVAETITLARDLLLVERTGARVHFGPLSAGPSVDMIRDAREHGLPVSADVAIHHMHLCEHDVGDFDANCHVRPPLRTSEDRERLRAGLAEGVVEAVCSDHQPHERNAKLNPFPLTEPGISGLDTLLGLALSLVDQGVCTLPEMVAAMTCRPAAVLGLDRGALSVGAVADLCVFDPRASWRPSPETMHSRGHNTPFLGRRMRGRVTHTLAGGEVVYRDARRAPPAAAGAR